MVGFVRLGRVKYIFGFMIVVIFLAISKSKGKDMRRVFYGFFYIINEVIFCGVVGIVCFNREIKY